MNNDRLRREIESLLKGYYRAGLAPSLLRHPVLGALGIARAAPREVGEPLPDPLDALYILESGLIVWTSSITAPLTIYTGDSLGNYFSGPGTDLSWGTSPAYLQGTYANAQFPISSPDITGSSYVSNIYTSTTPSDQPIPSRFTGLMRLAIQSKIGAKKQYSELTPAAWGDPDGKKTGILVDPDGGFWVAECGDIRMRARKLTIDTGLAALSEETGLSGVSDVLQKAWLLGFAKASTDEADVVLWETETALLGAPMAHGWHYNRAGDKVSVVRVERQPKVSGIDSDISRTYTLSVTWSLVDGKQVPSASLSTTTSANWRIYHGAHRLWYPSDDGSEYRLHYTDTPYAAASYYVDYRGNVAPVYCFYDKNDTLQIVNYKQWYATSVTNPAYSESGGCPANAYEKLIGTRETWEGGFYLSGYSPINKPRQSGTYVQRTMSVTQGTEVMLKDWQQCFGGLAAVSLETGGMCDGSTLYALFLSTYSSSAYRRYYATTATSAELHQNSSVISVPQGGQALIIPASDAEAAIAIEYSSNHYTSETIDTWSCTPKSTTNFYYSSRLWCGKTTYYGNPTAPVLTLSAPRYTHLTDGDGTFNGFAAPQFMSWKRTDYCDVSNTNSVQNNFDRAVYSGKIVTSGGSIDVINSDWDIFFSGDTTSMTKPILGDIVSSYMGGSIINPPSGDIVAFYGWPEIGGVTAYSRFIGGA